MQKSQTVINCILAAVVAFLAVDRFSSNREAYPLQNEVGLLEREFYLHYLATGKYPQNRDFLSQYSRHIVAAYPDRFRWDDDEVYLHFTPSVPYKFAPVWIGKPGDTFEHNAKVLWTHAPWYFGDREHYQANTNELEAAGVTLNDE